MKSKEKGQYGRPNQAHATVFFSSLLSVFIRVHLWLFLYASVSLWFISSERSKLDFCNDT
jgi:hypothetical protein